MWCDVDGKGIDTIHKRIVDLRILTISVPCGISKFLRKAYREVATKLVRLVGGETGQRAVEFPDHAHCVPANNSQKN